MATMCRRCKAPKWRGDPCANADCPTTSRQAPLRAKTKPVTVNVKHGFHAPAGAIRLLADYDMPISQISKWRTVA